jgi:hypothetical protein
MSFKVACANSRDAVMLIVFLEQCVFESDPAAACLAAIRRLAPQLREATRVLLISSCPEEFAEKDADIEEYVNMLKQSVECNQACPDIGVYMSVRQKGRMLWHAENYFSQVHGFDGLIVVLQVCERASPYFLL